MKWFHKVLQQREGIANGDLEVQFAVHRLTWNGAEEQLLLQFLNTKNWKYVKYWNCLRIEISTVHKAITWIVNLEKHTLMSTIWVSLFGDSVPRSADFYKLPDVHTSFLKGRLQSSFAQL